MTMWFSAALKFLIVVEHQGGSRYAKSVVLFRATDFDTARQEALSIGHSKEVEYANGDNAKVRWKFDSIETLDMLGDTIEDGHEVYSEFREVPHGLETSFDSELHPELSRPTQTGV